MPCASTTSARTAAGWSAGAPGRRRSLTAAIVAAPDASYLADRADSAGVPGWRQLTGSPLATAGGRLRQDHFWELVRCLARAAGNGA
jgi:hypothetical protein